MATSIESTAALSARVVDEDLRIGKNEADAGRFGGIEAVVVMITDLATARACQLPRPESLLAGHVWRPVKGRAAVAAAVAGDAEIPERAADWAPTEQPVEVDLEGGWVLHSGAGWSFPTEVEARTELLVTVRRLLAAPDLVPGGRAILIAPDGGAFRLWMLTPPFVSVASRLLAALVQRDVEQAVAALEDLARARAALVEQRGGPSVVGGSSAVAVQHQRVVLLSIGDGGEPIDEHAHALMDRAVEGDPEARDVLDAARACIEMCRTNDARR
jgi:hypothetical protein